MKERRAQPRKPKTQSLEGKRVELRVPRPGDVPEILGFYSRNRSHFKPWDPVRDEDFYTEEFWGGQVERAIDDFFFDRALRLFLFRKGDPRVIGAVNFNNIVRGAFHACYLGYSLDRGEQGQGYMTEALKVGIPYVFDSLDLHRIMANYIPRNKKSAAVLKRLGFVIEGRAKAYLRINGKWEDHVLTSLTNRAWKGVFTES